MYKCYKYENMHIGGHIYRYVVVITDICHTKYRQRGEAASHVPYRYTLFYCASVYCASQIWCFSKNWRFVVTPH